MAIRGSGNAYTRCVRRPGRTKKQTWTAKAVGRVACYARKEGISVDELLKELEECAPCKDENSKRCERQRLRTLEQNIAAMSDAVTVLNAIQLAMNALLLLGRFVPQLRSVVIPARLAYTQVAPAAARLSNQLRSNELERIALRIELERAGFSVIP